MDCDKTHPLLHYVLKNNGQSPAYNITGSYGLQVVKDATNIQKFDSKDIAPSIGANDTIKLHPEWPQSPSNDTWESISKKDSLLLIVGELSYDNIFDERCVFEFCFTWEKGGNWISCKGEYRKSKCD